MTTVSVTDLTVIIKRVQKLVTGMCVLKMQHTVELPDCQFRTPHFEIMTAEYTLLSLDQVLVWLKCVMHHTP